MSEIREPVTHNLKIWPEHYSAVCAGVKRAELRKNDRDYRVGDALDLCEWNRDDESFTGEFISATVTHVADVSEWMPGYVLLSIELALRKELERAEPVGEIVDQSDGLVMDGTVHLGGSGTHRAIKGLNKMKRMPLGTKFYTAPPAPVVPDALEQFAEFMAAESIKAGDYPDGWKCKAAKAAHDYAQACRAAMLAAPGKKPLSVDVLAVALRNAPLAPSDNQGRQRAPVAAGWIACSERMPEKDGNYWAWWSESKRQGPAWFIKSELQAQFQSSEITHWMPLPAAPGKEG